VQPFFDLSSLLMTRRWSSFSDAAYFSFYFLFASNEKAFIKKKNVKP